MLGSSIAVLALSLAVGLPPEGDKLDGLSVHEWGTFTSYSGPNASNVNYYRSLADNLPQFVQARFVGDRWISVGAAEFSKNVLRSTHRMETPVIYFHSPSEAEVSVEVSMPDGMITEVYPPVTSSTPAKLETPEIPACGTSVRWANVRLVPLKCCDSLSLPDAKGSHYAHARETAGDTVHVSHEGKEHKERFLFYRGVGNLNLGLKATPLGGDRFQLAVSHPQPASHVFAVENLDGKFRFAEYKEVKSGAEVRLPKEATSDAQLEAALTAALTEAGLLDDEAKAMVATWKKDWFGDEGTRVLVLLPKSLIDQVLPLTITPTPAKTTRVFVSRLEVLTPERLAWLEGVMQREVTLDFPLEAKEREYRKLGVFREPAAQMARESIARRGDGC